MIFTGILFLSCVDFRCRRWWIEESDGPGKQDGVASILVDFIWIFSLIPC